MADEGNERAVGRMDLNLYLGRPRSSWPQSSDLGSDLALSSLPLSTSSTTEESRGFIEMSSALELEPTDSHAPYSSSIPPISDNPNQEHTPYSPSHEPYDPTTTLMPPMVSVLPTLQETEEPVGNHVLCPPSYTPSYIPLDTQEANDALLRPYIPSIYSSPTPSYSPRSLPPFQGAELLDESSSRRELLECPEFRFRRLIESNHRVQLRRFRASLPYHGIDRTTSPVSDQQLIRDIMSTQRPLETNGKHKIHTEGIAEECSDDENKSVANFECNICLDTSQEPVVTSCGHLFCWPCLYQWLNVHSDHKECPVCKGEVTEANITPIYGRGSLEAGEGKTLVENGEPNLKIPARPRGSRFESLRQQFPPISWRRLVSQQMRAGHHAILNRLRARRLLGETTSIPQSSNANPPFEDGMDLLTMPQSSDTHPFERAELWHRVSMYGLYGTDETRRVAVNPPTYAADQVSGSSTTAVIQGDVGIPEGLVEPSSAGSSRAHRRRGRSGASSSFDVDGVLHASKRRRLN